MVSYIPQTKQCTLTDENFHSYRNDLTFRLPATPAMIKAQSNIDTIGQPVTAKLCTICYII